VTSECPISVGIFDEFTWIRCEGKGSFLTSPAVKSFGDERIAAGERCLVVDLAACSGMDSTFMGILAGLASRVGAQNGALQIAEPGERNRHSLEDLGLDFLMEIDPQETVWRPRIKEIREGLVHPRVLTQTAQTQRAHHVLEAHQELSTLSPENARKFAGVVSLLEAELAAPKDSR
jgi:anti-anti-sigma regulatory factor